MIRQILANYNPENHEETVNQLQIFLYKTSIRHLQSAYYKDGGRVPVTQLRKSVSDKIRDLKKILDKLDPPKPHVPGDLFKRLDEIKLKVNHIKNDKPKIID